MKVYLHLSVLCFVAAFGLVAWWGAASWQAGTLANPARGLLALAVLGFFLAWLFFQAHVQGVRRRSRERWERKRGLRP